MLNDLSQCNLVSSGSKVDSGFRIDMISWLSLFTNFEKFGFNKVNFGRYSSLILAKNMHVSSKWGKFSIWFSSHAKHLSLFTKFILARFSLVLNIPSDIQLTTVAFLTWLLSSPARNQIFMELVRLRDSTSRYCKLLSFAASLFSLFSQCAVIASLQWLRHLSGLQGLVIISRGSGRSYFWQVLRARVLHHLKLFP